MKQQFPILEVTAIRKGAQKTFDHWEMSVDGKSCDPPKCTASIDHGNNAKFKVTISDPDGPPSGQQQVTFPSNALSVPPTSEIHHIDPQGTTLEFQDHNWGSGELKYTLYFNNAPQIDPIIKNGGGGPPGGMTQKSFLPSNTTVFAIELAIAFILGVVLALVLRRLGADRETR